MIRFRLAALVAWLALATGASAEVLLRDDFDAASLDTAKWYQPEGCGSYYGRTQIRPGAAPLALRDGAIELEVDSFNPTGLSFFGSEIVSHAEFAPAVGAGVQVRARVRLLAPAGPGLDAAVFLYRVRPPATPCDAGALRDEIDLELLTSQIGSGAVLTNVYDAAPIGGAGAPAYPLLPGFDPREWTQLDLRWWADRIEWRVNGVLLRTETAAVPAGPMALRANFWAPASDFPEAFASPPDPVADADLNQQWVYAVDWVEVRTLPEPAGAAIVAFAALALIRRRARAAARGGCGRCSPRSRAPSPAPDCRRDR